MADDDTLRVRIVLDRTQSEAAAKAEAAAHAKIGASADATYKGVGKSARKAADGQIDQARRTEKELSRAAERAAKAQEDAGKRSARALDLAGAAAGKLHGSLTNLVSSNFTFATVLTGIKAVGSAFADSNKQLDDYANHLLKVKDDLKELATLRGLATASDDFIKGISQFSRTTGLSITQADEFQRQYYGSIAGGMQKGNIDQATADKAMLEGGRIAARQTKDLNTRGDLLGILPQFRKYDKGDKGVDQVLSDAEAVRQGLTEGRGDDAPLTKSLLHIAGSLAGEGKMVGTMPELAAILGVTSLSAGPQLADTRTEQLVRGLRGETPQQMDFMKTFAKIDEHDNLETRLDKMVPALRKKRAEGRDVQTFLTESGINAEQSRAIVEAEANYEVIKIRMANSRNAPSGAALRAESDRQAQIDPGQRQRMAEADLEAAKLQEGMQRQAIIPDITAAKARNVTAGQSSSFWTKIGDLDRSLFSGYGIDPEEARAQEEAKRRLQKQTGQGPGFFGRVGERIVSGIGLAPAVQGLNAMTGSTEGEIERLRKMLDAQSVAGSADVVKVIQEQTKVIQAQGKSSPPLVMPSRGNTGTVR